VRCAAMATKKRRGSTTVDGVQKAPPTSPSVAPSVPSAAPSETLKQDLPAFEPCSLCAARYEGRSPPLPLHHFTPCDVGRLCSRGHVVLVAHRQVYDVTDFVETHPGGPRGILRHTGQVCDTDFEFHSRQAQELWGKYKIGRSIECDGSGLGWSCAIS
jgi:cytochrome b involved in lipid metabolism